MRIVIIGTLHIMKQTEILELFNVLEHKICPTHLYVEIKEDDLKTNNTSKCPKEMVEVFHWAKARGLPCFGFDSGPSMSSKNCSEVRKNSLLKIDLEYWKNKSWKVANLPGISAKAWDLIHDLIDWENCAKRQNYMLKNIKDNLPTEGCACILTGAGHLDFFEKQFPNAELPFRTLKG